MSDKCQYDYGQRTWGGPHHDLCLKPSVPGYDRCIRHLSIQLLLDRISELEAELAAERDEKTALMDVLQAEHKAHEAKSESMKRIRSVLRETILKLNYMKNNSAGWQQRSNKFQSHLAEEREAHEATKRELAALKERLEKAISEGWVIRDGSDDSHWLFMTEPEWDKEYMEWKQTEDYREELHLGNFNSTIQPGKSHKVKIVEVEE